MSPPSTAVLVAGGAGYIGGHTVLELAAAGYQPIILDDFSTGSPGNLLKGCPVYRGDVADVGLVSEIVKRHGAYSVMHFAGKLVVPDSVRQPALYYRDNTSKSLSFATACVEAGVERFVFSSSAAVYGTSASARVDEDSPLAPISPYGASKAMTERMLKDISHAEPTFRTVSLRYFNVAGADALGRVGPCDPEPTHLIRRALQVHLGRWSALEVFGASHPTRDGTCERDFIHVADLAAAHVRTLAYLEQGGGSSVFNCGYGRGFTVREVIAELEALTGRKLPTLDGAPRAGDPASLIADAARAHAVLGWTPRHASLREILETALRWEAGLLESRR